MTTGFGRGDLRAEMEALDQTMSGAAAMSAAFAAELQAVQATMADTAREVAELKRGISSGLRQAIDGLVFDGNRLQDAFRKIGQSMIDAAYSAALRPVTSHVGGLLAGGVEAAIGSLLPFARGGGFSAGRVMPFATGGVVDRPTGFALRGGLGLMGEAGPEAILPLARGPDGRLGVRAGRGGAPVNVTFNITTPDVAGFRRSQSQIAAEMGRILARGQRNS